MAVGLERLEQNLGNRDAAFAISSTIGRIGMRFIIAVLLASSICSVTPQALRAAEPTDLLRSCEAVISAGHARNGDELDIPRIGLACWYYMSAVQNMSVLIDADGQPLLGICAPASAKLLDYVRIFVRYGRRIGRRVQENPAAVAVEALNAAFPCAGRTTAESKKARFLIAPKRSKA